MLHAYTSIARHEGVVGGLWRGTGANVTRNAIVNVGETVVYDAAKDALLTAGYMRWVGHRTTLQGSDEWSDTSELMTWLESCSDK